MNILHNMRVFARVAETRSFTAAANSLSCATGAVSRAVSDLEAHLQTRLINRSTRRLSLTESGELYLSRCQQIFSDIELAEEEASGAQGRAAGTLKVLSLASIGQHYLIPAVTEYLAEHPAVRVELNFSQSTPDLYGAGSDVAVFLAPSLSDSEMVSHLIGETFSVLCASPDYIEAHGRPGIPSELAHHNCLTLEMPSFSSRQWLLQGPDGSHTVAVNGSLQVNIAESLAAAIRSGMGIGVLPVYAALDNLRTGALVRILPEYTLLKTNIYVLYPSRKHIDRKTRTWVDFLRDYLSRAISRDEALLATHSSELATPPRSLSPLTDALLCV